MGGLGRELPKALRTGRRRRNPHRRPEERLSTKLVDMTMIDQRPAKADDRTVSRYWEGDLITGEQNRSAIGTLVERRSRFTILLHLPGRHTAEAVRDAIIAAFAPLPPELRRSLTWDQGSELGQHAEIAAALGMPVFFCEPHSPWQRPTTPSVSRDGSVRLRSRTIASRLRRPVSGQAARITETTASAARSRQRSSTTASSTSGSGRCLTLLTSARSQSSRSCQQSTFLQQRPSVALTMATENARPCL